MMNSTALTLYRRRLFLLSPLFLFQSSKKEKLLSSPLFPPTASPHLIQHLFVTLHSLFSPSLKQQRLLNTNTCVDSISLSSLPQTTTKYSSVSSTAPHSRQSTSLPENRFLHLSPRVLVRHRNMSTDPNVFLYIPHCLTIQILPPPTSLPFIHHLIQLQLSHIP